MKRPVRILPVLLALLGALGAACGGERPRPGTPPRCVLLLTVEGLRADHVTAYGYIRQTTRVRKESAELVLDIDRMARTGVAFHDAFAPTPEVYASLASLLTGATPRLHGALERGQPLSEEVSTLAEDLAAGGFATAAFVGADRALLGTGLERGFEVWGEYATDTESLQAATAWLQEQAPRSGRIFLWVHFGELREPFAGAPLADLYSVEDDAAAEFDLAPERFLDEARGARERRRLIDRYDGALARTNLLLHTFLEYYRFGFLADRLFDDSLIVVCGTNGVELAEREGRVGPGGALLEETLRVPLILRHPGSLTGRRIFSEPVTLADVAPTVREWFGVAAARPGSGRSLLAITDSYVEREFESRPAQAWLSLDGELRAQSLRDERWRAVFERGETRLHDLTRDPGERVDLSAEHPELLEAWRARLDPPLPAAPSGPAPERGAGGELP